MAKVVDILPVDQVTKLMRFREQLANVVVRAKLNAAKRDREARTVDAA